MFEKCNAVVGDAVSEVVVVVVVVMPLQPTPVAQRVVVEARVSNQAYPLIPANWCVSPVVLVEVLAKVTCLKQNDNHTAMLHSSDSKVSVLTETDPQKPALESIQIQFCTFLSSWE